MKKNGMDIGTGVVAIATIGANSCLAAVVSTLRLLLLMVVLVVLVVVEMRNHCNRLHKDQDASSLAISTSL